MGFDLAGLKITVDSTQVKSATELLDRLSVAADKAGTSVKNLGTTQEKAKKSATEIKDETAKLVLTFESQIKSLTAVQHAMMLDEQVARSAAVQRRLYNSALASGKEVIESGTIALAKQVEGLKQTNAVTTAMTVATKGLTTAEVQSITAKAQHAIEVKKVTDAVRLEYAAKKQSLGAADAHVAAYNREIAASRAYQETLAKEIIAMQRRQNAELGLSTGSKTLFSAYSQDPNMRRAVPIQSAPVVERDVYSQFNLKSYEDRVKGVKALTAELDRLQSMHVSSGAAALAHKQTIHSVEGAINQLTHGSSRARGEFRKMASAMASMTFEMTGAIYGMLALAAAIAAPIVPGVKLAKTMEDTSLGMAAILISMGKIDGASIELPQALQISGEMMDKLVNDSMRFGVSIEALANTLRSTLAPGLAAGMNLEEIQKVATIGTIAVRTIGLDAKQTVQEVRDLVAGGIQAASSTLATSLGIKDADIKRWRDAGTIYEELMNKMLGFQIAAGENAKTLSGAWGILQTKIALLMNSEEGFNALKGIVIDISNYIGKFNDATNRMEFNPELVKQAKAYWDILLGIKDVLVAVGNVALVVSPALVPALQTIAVLLSEITFTISTVAKEIAVIATQAVAVAHLDFKAASGIGAEWKAEAEAARAAQDERVKKILGLSVAVPPVAPADSGAGKVKGTPSPSESWAKLYQDQVQKKADAIKKLDEQYAIETRRFADNQEHQIGLAKDYQVKLDVINKQFDKKKVSKTDYEYKAEKSAVDRIVKQQNNEIAILESAHQHKLISEEQYQSQLEGIYENYETKILKDYGHSMMRLQDKIDSTQGAEQQAATDHYNKMLADVEGYLAKRGLRILNSTNREKQILQESAAETASFIAKATEDVKAIESKSGDTRRRQDMSPVELAGYDAGSSVSKLFDIEIAVRSAKASRLMSDGMAETSAEVIAQRNAIKDLISARDSLADRAEKGAIKEAEYARSFESGMRDALKKYSDEATNVASHVEGVMTSAFKGIEDALVKFVETGKLSFKDLASSIIKDMMRTQIKENITGPLAKWLKGLKFGGGENLSAAAGLDSISYTAHGNVFASPGLSAHSNTVVDRPTLFPFAHGIGMMGEAGAEAIMPLKRLSGGDLGVKAEVAPINIVINNNAPTVISRREVTDSRGRRSVVFDIDEAVAGEMRRPGSASHQALRGGFGAQPVLTGR